ncbi:MAG: glycosyltransferase [Rhodomicrobium sp.]|nr:glycosyltransferase [Rhodomicrobium sp.]
MRQDLLVSVIIPLENDCDLLPGFAQEIDEVMSARFGTYELIFVDDGSADGTRSFFEGAKAKIANFRYVRLTRPFGLEAAIACGLELAIGDVIVVLNPGDRSALAHPAVRRAGQRHGRHRRRREDRAREPAARLPRRLCRLLRHVPDFPGAGAGLRRDPFHRPDTYSAQRASQDQGQFPLYPRARDVCGFAVTAVPYEFVSRREPPRRRQLIPLLANAGNMIVSNSDRPLQIAAFLSALMAVADFLFIIYVIAMRLLWPNVEPGWASTNMFNAVMFAVMFLVLAMICQYLAAIRSEIKSRPLYVIQSELQSNVMPGSDGLRNVVTHEDRADSVPMRRHGS